MAISTSKYLPVGFGLLFAICTALSLLLMFKAGCAGDTKGGSLGDPSHAFHLEGLSLILLLLGGTLGGAAISLMSNSIHRVAQGLAFAIFTVFGLWLAGIQLEIWGVQSCF